MLERAFKITRKEWLIFFCIATVVCLLVSKFALTIALIGILAAALLDFNVKKNYNNLSSTKWPAPVKGFLSIWNADVFKILPQFYRHKGYFALFLIFIIVIISGLWSADLGYWWERVRIKLNFLAVPLGFALLPGLKAKEFTGILYVLLGLMFVICLGISIHYALNFEELTLASKQGRTLPTPIHHIRFSLILVFSILSGIYLFYKNYFIKYKWERFILLGITIFLFGFMHLLAVRSGLLALYAALFVGVFHQVFLSKKYLLGILALGFIFALPFLAYKNIPSFYEKINYTFYNLEQFQKGEIEDHSDAERLVSYEAGWNIAKENLLLGVGFGDLKNKTELYYKNNYPNLPVKLPHNQFLLYFLGSGIFGLLGFIACYLTPLFYKNQYKNTLFLAFYVIATISLLFENTLETAIGSAFFIFFCCLVQSYLEGEREKQ